MSLFEGQGLVCRRGERLVFRNLSFRLDAGGALLLTGPNGSGKSSLLRLMAGLLGPEAGAIRWLGSPIGTDMAAHRERLHFIGHQDAVKSVLTAAETLAFWSGMRGGAPSDVGAALERFALDHLAALPCRFLSAGQKKRLALARLLASPASLWLLDEPTTGLDDGALRVLENVLAEHRAAGGIVVATTHVPLAIDNAETLGLADFAPDRAAISDAWEVV